MQRADFFAIAKQIGDQDDILKLEQGFVPADKAVCALNDEWVSSIIER